MAQTFTSDMLQCCPRLDSITALYLLLLKERRLVERDRVKFWGHGTVNPNGQTWQDFANQGVRCIGILGSPYDEHPSQEFGDGKAAGLSTTMLVARDLGIENDPLYANLVKAVTRHDLGQGGGDAVEGLGQLVKLAHRNGRDSFEVIQMVFGHLDDIISKQERFLAARSQIEQDATFHNVGRNGRSYKVAVIWSENDEVAAASRSLGIDIMIQWHKSGHVQIYTNRKSGISLKQVAEAIRYHEMVARGRRQEAERVSTEELSRPGQIALVPNWCYMMPGDCLLNSSETACDLEPTALSPDFVVEKVGDYFQLKEAVL